MRRDVRAQLMPAADWAVEAELKGAATKVAAVEEELKKAMEAKAAAGGTGEGGGESASGRRDALSQLKQVRAKATKLLERTVDAIDVSGMRPGKQDAARARRNELGQRLQRAIDTVEKEHPDGRAWEETEREEQLAKLKAAPSDAPPPADAAPEEQPEAEVRAAAAPVPAEEPSPSSSPPAPEAASAPAVGAPSPPPPAGLVECDICTDETPPSQMVTLDCGHVLCARCVTEIHSAYTEQPNRIDLTFENGGASAGTLAPPSCPHCRQRISEADLAAAASTARGAPAAVPAGGESEEQREAESEEQRGAAAALAQIAPNAEAEEEEEEEEEEEGEGEASPMARRAAAAASAGPRMRLIKERVKEEVTYMDERGYMVTEEKWVEKEVMKEAPPTPPSRPAVRAPVAPKHSVAAALAEAAAADDDDDDAPAGKKGKAKAKAKGGAAKPAAKPKAKKDTAAQGSIKSFLGRG